LKRLWSAKASDNEITQKDAISIVRKMNPQITPEDAKWATKVGSKVMSNNLQVRDDLSVWLVD